VKAGALSAVATLWPVNDESSAKLIPSFYAHLRDSGTSKAQALRAAQLELLKGSNETLHHPFFWSPYLIVGNWL
jgi:CHAT domain-containing protein